MLVKASSMAHETASVLIAEDSPTQSEHLRALLEQNGFEVISARNGREALALARTEQPSVIVSDVVMPEMDGYTLCRSLKSDPALKSIPAILVTELSSPQDVFKGLEAGADNFLVKPYEEQVLVSRISYLLANKRLRTSEKLTVGIEIEVAGKRHLITAERQQILDLLISTYDQAVVLYDRLDARQKELARSYDTLNALYGLAGGLNRCRTERQVAAFALGRAMRIPGVRTGWLNLRQGGGFKLTGYSEETLAAEGIDTACAHCTCQRLLDAGELTGARNIESCERLRAVADGGPGGHVSIPLVVEGRPAGVLNLIGNGPNGRMQDDDLRTLTSVGNQISDALERARLHEALERKVEERTRAQQAEVVERRQAEEAARRAGERLLDAIECISDGFALYDAGEQLLVCNQRYREVHAAVAPLLVPGESLETLLRAGLDREPDAEGEPGEAQVEAGLAQHRQASGKPVIRQRGDTWLMTSTRRTREGGIVVIDTDISELKKVDKAKDEFLAKVSHELRTPLTSIGGVLALLEAGKLGEVPESLHRLASLAHRNCSRLLCIVNDLLDMTNINAGNFHLQLQMTELQPILDQVLESKSIGPDAPVIRLVVRPGAGSVRVLADPVRIQQVLDNLLTNAVKFSPPGSEITVVAEQRPGSVRVSVIDHGIGVTEDFKDRMFDAFTQADSSSTRQRGGTGLGLSIAKTIIEAHQGEIGFVSTEGQGSTFYFELPVEQAAGEDILPPRQDQSAA